MPHFRASPVLEVESFIPWYGQNKGVGRRSKNRRGCKQGSIRKHLVFVHALFWGFLNAPQTRSLNGGGGSYCVAFGHESLCIHF